MPKLSTKGRILYVNWETPLYLGGINSSLISFEPYKTDNTYKNVHNLNDVKGYDCDGDDKWCNLTVSYSDLRIGIEKFYYVILTVEKSANGMCQRYNTPGRIKSMESSIKFTTIVGEWLHTYIHIVACYMYMLIVQKVDHRAKVM